MSEAAAGRSDAAGQASRGPGATSALAGPGTGRAAGGGAAVGTFGRGWPRRLVGLRDLDGAVLRYRILAYIVGVGLATLVFVGIPLQALGHDGVVTIVGPIHGFFYLAYLLFALDLSRRARFSLGEMLAMAGAGLLPILAFVIERRITRRVQTGQLQRWSLPSWLRRRAGPAEPRPPGS